MGLLFDAGTIAEFTRISESEMPDHVTVTTYTMVDGEMGGRVKTDPVIVTTKGRVDRFGQISQHVLLLSIPLGIEVQDESTITVISERVGYSGVYVVESAESGSYAVHQQFLLTPESAA